MEEREMYTMRNNPHIYEINLMSWLDHLSQREGKKILLGEVPFVEWQSIKDMGIDAVWLMGMWERSPRSQDEATRAQKLVKECREVLADFRLEDLGGSPYAVRYYRPDPCFGNFNDLKKLWNDLGEIGLYLILDFVPNHTACDHPWVQQHPEYYINKSMSSDGSCSNGFFKTTTRQGPMCIAHGKDPYFPPWTDTAQLNYMNPDTQRAMEGALSSISNYCDGLRCDMAMLVFSEIFQKNWGQYLNNLQATQEFWPYAINRTKQNRVAFTFIAEAYWGLQKRLLEAGFDYAYDKDFYDALANGDIDGLKRQLGQPVPDQERMLRFLENHDEPRAMKVFGPDKILAAMVIHATVPGAKLYHQGQFEGRALRVPVQLKRLPYEPVHEEILQFSARLLAEVNNPIYHNGHWQMCGIDGWLDNQSCKNLLAWTLHFNSEGRLIAVNFSPIPSQGRIRLPFDWIQGKGDIRLFDIFKEEEYVYERKELRKDGLYVALNSWDFHFFHVS